MARNKGFSLVEIVIVLVIIGLVALVGWRVWSANQSTYGTDQTDTSQTQDAPTINSDKDLDKASSQLDSTNIEGAESQQLDTETNF